MILQTYIAADNIVSPLGFTTEENFSALKKGQTGIACTERFGSCIGPVFAALIDEQKIEAAFRKIVVLEKYSRLEKMVILSVSAALKQTPGIDIADKKTLIVLSTTKGNIDLLDRSMASQFDKKRLYLWEAANVITRHFKNPNKPVVISNACVSGVLAIITAKRLLEDKHYETIVVTGVDILTPFVISGFQSFKAVSRQIAKPFDIERDGISLGEACGTVVLTNNKSMLSENDLVVEVKGGASSNDANHISGPSRTGDGLLLAIQKALAESKMSPGNVDFISAHGTATVFNDEMEAIAISDARLGNVPLNSLKSYFGHTLGAAGIIESIIGIQSMRDNTLIGTYNFTTLGVSKPVNIIRETTIANVNNCLKTASGFGSCNAAVLFQKQ